MTAPLTRIAWLTDLHLNFLEAGDRRRFLEKTAAENPDAFFVGGDTGEANSLISFLGMMEGRWRRPIYLVLGNHDYYRGTIAGVSGAADEFCGRSRYVTRLDRAGVVELTPNTALVGHGGWGDARYGNWRTTDVILADFSLIQDLAAISRDSRINRMRELGDEAAAYFREYLPRALDSYQRVIILTHVPPFKEASWHEGRISGDDWLPYFTCKAAGDVIKEVASSYPDQEVLVLCGHTHGGGMARISPNLEAITGDALYFKPKIQMIIEVE